MLYITAQSGSVGQIPGGDRRREVVLNELGTIGSAFAAPQFLDGTKPPGPELGYCQVKQPRL